MYLSKLKLWNFRKYGINGDDYETSKPGVIVNFNKGLNVEWMGFEEIDGKQNYVLYVRLKANTSIDWTILK